MQPLDASLRGSTEPPGSTCSTVRKRLVPSAGLLCSGSFSSVLNAACFEYGSYLPIHCPGQPPNLPQGFATCTQPFAWCSDNAGAVGTHLN